MPGAYSAANPADRQFVRSAMKAPLLAPEHEASLARRWRQGSDEAALHELTTAYMRLVISMAGRFRHYGLPMADLVSEGNVGLMQAAARFEPEREVRFSTYASWWIRSAIQDYVLRNWSIVRTGTTAAQKSLFFNLRRLKARIDDTGEGSMTPENQAWVARHLGVTMRDVETMSARLSASDRSLNAPLASDVDTQWQDLIADEGIVPEEAVMQARDAERRHLWIQEAMTALNPRETYIISRRRLAEEPITLEALGGELGVSKERVRQIEHQAMQKLKQALESIAGDPETAGLIPNT
ncbi:RNA polymerase factor sigma-32 [Hyphomonas sp. WL0036]|uniref:RNA polymerase factor sigma-32 n=1 Tax=Hyphomonas sediminis TaxID=2866160 RepID=UPI001C81E5F3|nr:RNA polymerase factor sigma-32 [Hyphomonas sediminis]